MAIYHFHFRDIDDRLVMTELHECNDDLEALQKARELCVDHRIEVESGARFVARVKQNDRPLAVADRVSL